MNSNCKSKILNPLKGENDMNFSSLDLKRLAKRESAGITTLF